MHMIRYIMLLFVFGAMVCANRAEATDTLRRLQAGDRVPRLVYDILATPGERGVGPAPEGKLIILDFWNTNCVACIAAFPRLEQLQQEMDGDIQVFLVNTRETPEEIEAFFRKTGKKLPSLPVIAGAASLGVLFPHRYIPHHVWIGPDGRVKLMGAAFNTHKEKILKCLRDEPVTSMNNQNTADIYDFANRYKSSSPRLLLDNGTGVVAPYDNRFYPFGMNHENQVDTSEGTVRSTFINRDIISLYYTAYQLMHPEESYRKIMGPHLSEGYRDLFLLETADTVAFTTSYLRHGNITDETFMACRYCYEQEVPADTPDPVRGAWMFNDLNTMISKRLKAKASIVSRLQRGYVLERYPGTPAGKPLAAREALDETVASDASRPIQEIVETAVRELCKVNGSECPFVFDGTETVERVICSIPEWKRGDTVSDLNKVLHACGYRLRYSEVPVKRIRISPY